MSDEKTVEPSDEELREIAEEAYAFANSLAPWPTKSPHLAHSGPTVRGYAEGVIAERKRNRAAARAAQRHDERPPTLAGELVRELRDALFMSHGVGIADYELERLCTEADAFVDHAPVLAEALRKIADRYERRHDEDGRWYQQHALSALAAYNATTGVTK
jgi:hypothetical protein